MPEPSAYEKSYAPSRFGGSHGGMVWMKLTMCHICSSSNRSAKLGMAVPSTPHLINEKKRAVRVKRHMNGEVQWGRVELRRKRSVAAPP